MTSLLSAVAIPRLKVQRLKNVLHTCYRTSHRVYKHLTWSDSQCSCPKTKKKKKSLSAKKIKNKNKSKIKRPPPGEFFTWDLPPRTAFCLPKAFRRLRNTESNKKLAKHLPSRYRTHSYSFFFFFIFFF